MMNNYQIPKQAENTLLCKSRVFHCAFIMLLSLHFLLNFEANAQTTIVLPAACATCPTSSPTTNGTGVVSSYGAPTCSANVITGTMTAGTAVSGVTMELYANVTTLGTYDITAGPTNGVTFTGSGIFAALGCQLVTLTATGTPTAEGPFTWCTNTTPQGCSPATVVTAGPINPLGIGSLSGKACFDIALSNDDINSCGPLSARLVNQSDFTDAATHTQSYTFTPSGTVSNVRFLYINTNGSPITAISGDNTGDNISTPVVATVNYATTLNADALGLTNSNPLTADIYVIYNDGATNNGADKQLKLTPQLKDCACCGAYISPTVWKEFLCHNLGADTSLDPHSPVAGLQGAYIQWGRRGPNITGDSRVDWQTATNDGPSGFAAAPKLFDNANEEPISGWLLDDAPPSAWQISGAKTVNDPCPTGYRVPSHNEWNNVINNNTASRTGTFTTSSIGYGSALHYGPNAATKLLTLPAAGRRNNSNGLLANRGSNGYYWSHTQSTGGSSSYFFTSTVAGRVNADRTQGYSVRCIAE